MSDEMYLLLQITHHPLLITRDPSLITVLPSLVTHYSSVDVVALGLARWLSPYARRYARKGQEGQK